MTLRCALVGTGYWAATALLPALRALPDATVVGCVSATRAEADEFAGRHGIAAAFANIDALLAGGPLDVVVVATPDDVHAVATAAALAAGVAVYCEKPLANEAAVAGRLADLADRAGVPATVGYSFRYNPAIQALKADLRGGRLGQPWLIELYEHNPQFHPARGKAMNWKGDPAKARAGALFEYGSHVVDLAGWLVGPIRRVSTSFARVLPGARLDDIATLQLQFDAPAIGTLVASWVLSGGFPGIRIRLHGSAGLGEVQIDEGLEGGQVYRRIPLGGIGGDAVPLEPMEDWRSDATRRHLADLAASIRGQPTAAPDTLPTLRQGALVQAVLEATLAATDRWARVEQEGQPEATS
jgi:predicted dehydrogenase